MSIDRSLEDISDYIDLAQGRLMQPNIIPILESSSLVFTAQKIEWRNVIPF